MKVRLLVLLRLYVTLLLIFVSQKALFMLVNMGYADGAPFGRCIAALWHGLRLDSVTAAYILVIPLLVMIVSCFFKHFPLRNVLKPYCIVIGTIMALVFAADLVLYHFWGAKIDAADLFYAAKPKDMLASVKWWTIPIGIAAIALLAFHYCRRLLHAFSCIKNKKVVTVLNPVQSRWLALIFLPLAGLVFLGMRGGISESTANPSYAYFSKYPFCNHSALNPLFNMMHSMFKTENLANEFVFMPDDEAQRIAAPLFVSDAGISDSLLVVERPDILLIVWESAGWNMVMNDSVAPNLMRYSCEGVCFSNCYADNFRTDRGLVSLLSGWMGLPTTSLMKMNDKCRKLPGLAKTLHSNGYATRFVYGGDIDFTNMRGYLLETGFDDVSGSEAFPQSRHKSSWGAPDECTLLPWVVADETHHSPCFTTLLTLSSHEPWQVPIRRLADDRKNTFAYTDSCLGVMLDSLRMMPQWDNLLVIIVPDHGVAMNSSQSTSDPSVAHIPMVWTGGAVTKHSDIDIMMMQSDLPATLLAQLGIDSHEFFFSRNVLSPHFAERYLFALHCFKNGCNLFDSTGVIRFDCADRKCSPEGSDKEQHIQALIQYIYQRTAKL